MQRARLAPIDFDGITQTQRQKLKQCIRHGRKAQQAGVGLPHAPDKPTDEQWLEFWARSYGYVRERGDWDQAAEERGGSVLAKKFREIEESA